SFLDLGLPVFVPYGWEKTFFVMTGSKH
ncbi:hypothetical protein TNIN_493011, partial [Trichonephila inaurata madagascariensis]